MKDNADLLDDILDSNEALGKKLQDLDDLVEEYFDNCYIKLTRESTKAGYFYGAAVIQPVGTICGSPNLYVIGSAGSDDRDEAIQMAESEARKCLRKKMV